VVVETVEAAQHGIEPVVDTEQLAVNSMFQWRTSPPAQRNRLSVG
jgi:hypothetical protein